MRNRFPLATSFLSMAILIACSASDTTTPATAASAKVIQPSASWGPETPNFNNEIILRGDGFGLVKFRQPNDADRICISRHFAARPCT